MHGKDKVFSFLIFCSWNRGDEDINWEDIFLLQFGLTEITKLVRLQEGSSAILE